MRPRGPRGQKQPRESDQPAECGGENVCGPRTPGQRGPGRDKDGPSGAAPGSAPKRPEPAGSSRPGAATATAGPSTPRLTKSAPARRLSPSHRPHRAQALTSDTWGALPDPCQCPAGRPGRQLLGLEPRRRRRRAPNGREGGGSGASPRSPSGSFGTAALRSRPPVWGRAPSTPPTRSHTIPEASGARALCRSGAASRPGPEMAAEQRESGLRRARVRLAGGRGPPRERSAAVA